MKTVKLAAGVMMPVMFLNGSRHPHTDGPAFQAGGEEIPR